MKSSLPQHKRLADEARGRDHARRQELFDALTNVGKIAIYIIPMTIGALYLIVLIHKAFATHDWAGVESDVKSLLIPVSTYFAGLMAKNGLLQR